MGTRFLVAFLAVITLASASSVRTFASDDADSGNWGGGAQDMINQKKVPSQIREDEPLPVPRPCRDSQGNTMPGTYASYDSSGCANNGAPTLGQPSQLPTPVPTRFYTK